MFSPDKLPSSAYSSG